MTTKSEDTNPLRTEFEKSHKFLDKEYDLFKSINKDIESLHKHIDQLEKLYIDENSILLETQQIQGLKTRISFFKKILNDIMNHQKNPITEVKELKIAI